MRVLPGLLVAAVLLVQPAAAAAKDRQDEDKAARQEEKAARKPAAEEPAAPAGRPAATRVAAPPARVRPAHASAPTRRAAPHAPADAAAVRAAPAGTTALPAPSVPATPALAAPAPAGARPPAAARRPRARRSAPRPRGDVLAYRASGARTRRTAPPPAALAPVLPAVATRRAAAAIAATRAPVRTGRRPPAASPTGSATVTRVVGVVPPPLRVALAVLAALVGVLGLRARGLERQRRGLSEDLGLLQSALLPELPPRIGGAWVSAAYRPAEGLAAGGDFYDAFALDAHRTCLIVGDVGGHGRDAVPITADVRFTLRAYLEAGLAPRAALAATAEVVEPRLGGRFVTVVVAILDARNGRLTYAAAGHPPPLLTGSGEHLMTSCACPAIGTGLPTGRRQTTIALPPGATACFYTDGLCDAAAGGRRLGPSGVERYLRALGPRAQAEVLLEHIVRDTDAQPDDMAACLVRPQLGAAGAARERVEELEVSASDRGRGRRFLLACGVPAAEADEALAAAMSLLPVVLQVACSPGGAAVAVHRPDTAALSVP